MSQLRAKVRWVREPRNPVLPPGPRGSFDSKRCMNPWAMRVGDEVHLYYSGGDSKGVQRICLATAAWKAASSLPASGKLGQAWRAAATSDLTKWTRHGPVLDVGPPGSFDAKWCVLPHVVQVAPDRWHLYYTANCGKGSGLSAFPGIGLAVSDDRKRWTKHAGNPVLAPSGKAGDDDAVGMAGGSVLKVRLPGGGTEWRFYYTGCPTLGKPLKLNQQKRVCLAVSHDAVRWEKRGAVMLRRDDVDYEDVAAAGPVVHQNPDGTFRMWYSAIGTRWGFYSICYAESDDGLRWRRGTAYGDNLQLTPQGTGWEKQMVEYPSVIDVGGRLHMFYCGNGYGKTGIGMAVAAPS